MCTCVYLRRSLIGHPDRKRARDRRVHYLFLVIVDVANRFESYWQLPLSPDAAQHIRRWSKFRKIINTYCRSFHSHPYCVKRETAGERETGRRKKKTRSSLAFSLASHGVFDRCLWTRENRMHQSVTPEKMNQITPCLHKQTSTAHTTCHKPVGTRARKSIVSQTLADLWDALFQNHLLK